MKIEFCCEEMESAYYYGRHKLKRAIYLSPPKTVMIDTWEGPTVLNTCPYCGAKIEITVKDDKS